MGSAGVRLGHQCLDLRAFGAAQCPFHCPLNLGLVKNEGLW